MRSHGHGKVLGVLIPIAAWVVVGACGASRSVTYDLANIESPGDVFACAEQAVKDDGFEIEYRNERNRRLVASRTREDISRSELTFQRALDQLVIEVPEDDGPRFEVTARTFFEYWDRRGRTRRQHEPTPEVQADARRLLDRCGSGGMDGAR